MTNSVATESMIPIKILLKEYRNDVNIAASSFYAWKTINNLATSDEDVYCTLNAHALSWKIISDSLLVTFLVALGRIFDGDERSVSVHKLLDVCKKEIAQFNKPALAARNQQEPGGIKPTWLDEFLQDSYEPKTSDFDELAQIADQHQKTYKSKYQPIRHKVIAHTDLMASSFKDALFSNTNIPEVEEVLKFLRHVERFVEDLYMNGVKTNFVLHKFDDECAIRDDLKKLLGKLPN